MTDNRTPDGKDELSLCTRICLALVAALVLAYSALLAYEPPVRRSNERDWTGNVIKRVAADADTTSLSIAVFTAAALLGFYSLNGVRMHEIQWGGGAVSSKPKVTHPPDKETAEKLKPEPELDSGIASDVPQPVAEGQQVETREGETFTVFGLTDVPAQVISDAIASWPADNSSKPVTLESFEFALRKPGKGNNPWMLQFRAKRPVKVSYGGQGKAVATVTSM